MNRMLAGTLIAALALTAPGCGTEGDLEVFEESGIDESMLTLAGSPLGATAVSASAHDGNIPANALDGSLGSRWSCSGVGCWIRVDLGAVRSVTGLAVAWYVGDQRASSWEISVSSDDRTYTQVSAGNSSGTTIQLEPYAFAATAAQYVRLTVNGNTRNDWASVTELRVYGGDVAATAPTPSAAGAPAGGPLSVTGVSASAHDGNAPVNAVDGSFATRWSCDGIGCWIRADLGAVKSVTGLAAAWYVGDRRASSWVISVSSDDRTYAQVLAGRSSGTTIQLEPYAFAATAARYVRLTVNGNTMNTWASVTELRVYGGDAVGTTPSPTPTPTPSPTTTTGTGVDAFGTKNLYPSATSGRAWRARWDTSPRVLAPGQVDPLDPEFSVRGSSYTLDIRGDGTAKVSGDQIRLYVGDPTRTKKWLNVELTVYGKRVSEKAGAPSTTGFEFQARTDDGHTSSTRLNAAGLPIQCDGKSYGFSFRADGRGLFEKELKHPIGAPQRAKNVWNGAAFPKNQWVGMKMVVYSVNGGRNVKQELWRDLTDGAGGGTWVKVHESLDAGGWAIDSATAASCSIAPDHIITTAGPLVIIRNEMIAEGWYKKVTIREIASPSP